MTYIDIVHYLVERPKESIKSTGNWSGALQDLWIKLQKIDRIKENRKNFLRNTSVREMTTLLFIMHQKKIFKIFLTVVYCPFRCRTI